MEPTRSAPRRAVSGKSSRTKYEASLPPARTWTNRRESRATVPHAAMITIGCAGFPVPATRYFKEFLFVEVQETHLAQPGTGTIRRWRREAPPGFGFALLAPREIGQEGFREGKVTETALRTLGEVARELEAQTA